MDEDNLTRQVDEIEAMSSIFGDDWCVVDEINRIYCIAVRSENNLSKICIQVLLPNGYPSDEPPIYQLNAPWLTRENGVLLETSLADICSENEGESVLYLLVEKVREFVEENAPEETKVETETHSSPPEGVPSSLSINSSNPAPSATSRMDERTKNKPSLQLQFSDIEIPEFLHGEPITDRRSTFQAHLASPVVEVKQVKLLLQKLLENKKIASACHNVVAYRIFKEDNGTFIQDCDNDGEAAAGGRLLHLLEIVDARNVLVVVTRWYGGILLGPDRFKHINNAARTLLESSGFIHNKDTGSHKPSQKKGKQKHR